jgi:hypothetical protein
MLFLQSQRRREHLPRYDQKCLHLDGSKGFRSNPVKLRSVLKIINKNKMKRNRIGGCVAVMVGLLACFGVQGQINLSGSWAFKEQQSVFGTLYANGSPKTVVIQQEADAISLTKITASTGSDVTTTETVTFDGKPAESTTASKRKKLITGSWSSDKKSFIEMALVYDAVDSTKLFFRTTDTWSLDNGSLILDRKAENQANGEIWESKATYDKR